MSMKLDALYILENDSGVTDLVGQAIYFQRIPQSGGLPAVVLQVVTTRTNPTLGGSSTVDQPFLQIDCYATTYASATEIEDAVIAAMDGSSYQSIQSALLNDKREQFDTPLQAYRMILEFSIINDR